MADYNAPDGFDERVRATLGTKFPELVFRVTTPGTIDVLPRGGREPVAQIGLTSLAAKVLAAPDKEAQLVAEHVGKLPFSQLTEQLRGMSKPDPQRIYPRLLPQKRIDALPAIQRPAQMNFHGDVRVVLVAEFPYGDLYITARDLEELGQPWPEALTKACANLARYLRACSIRAGAGPDGKPNVIVMEGHKHAAAALLLPEFPASLASQLGEEFFVCVPSFDQLFAFRTEPEDLVKNMVATAKRAYEISDLKVTTQLFKVDPESVTPVELTDGPKIWLPS